MLAVDAGGALSFVNTPAVTYHLRCGLWRRSIAVCERGHISYPAAEITNDLDALPLLLDGSPPKAP